MSFRIASTGCPMRTRHASTYRLTDVASIAGAIALVAWSAGCGGPPAAGAAVATAPPPPAPARPSEVSTRKVTLEDVGLSGSILDRSTSPCDDFYQFACGAWLKSATIPPEQAAYTRSFSEMAKRTYAALEEMLAGFAAEALDPKADPAKSRIGNFYAACMDEATIDALGTSPIDDFLRRIDRARDMEALGRVIYDLDMSNAAVFVRLNVSPDPDDASRITALLGKGGWELSHDEYTKADPRSTALRERLRTTYEQLFEGAKTPRARAAKRAKNTVAIEAALAAPTSKEASASEGGSKGVRWSLADLERESPRFPWKVYLEKARLPEGTTFYVGDPEGLRRLSDILAKQPIEAMRDYLAGRTLIDFRLPPRTTLPSGEVRAPIAQVGDQEGSAACARLRARRGVHAGERRGDGLRRARPLRQARPARRRHGERALRRVGG